MLLLFCLFQSKARLPRRRTPSFVFSKERRDSSFALSKATRASSSALSKARRAAHPVKVRLEMAFFVATYKALASIVVATERLNASFNGCQSPT